MTPVYMPFTYLSESTARLLKALVGPVAVYRPLSPSASEDPSALAAQGLVDLRTPLTGDDDRLRAALSEFTRWAQMNPGKSTPGADFFGSRQGAIPFFDDSTINRIRSEIRRHGTPEETVDPQETAFSARLFLAVAEENDRATDRLDHDLKRFGTLERGLLDSLDDGDETDFSRHGLGTPIWQEDPGARLTDRRIRAWAALAAADRPLPGIWVTTSPAVVETVLDRWEASIGFVKLGAIQLDAPPAHGAPLLGSVLVDLVARPSLTPADAAPFTALGGAGGTASSVSLTLYAAAGRSPAASIRRMAPAGLSRPEKNDAPEGVRHTLMVLVEQ